MSAANRAVLGVIGLLLIVGGVAMLLAITGALEADQPGSLYRSTTDAITARPALWWTLLLLGLVLVTVLALLWALRQLVVHRPGAGLDRVVLAGGERGTTTVDATAVARAVARDLRRIPGVTDASARIVGDRDAPSLRATLDTTVTSDLDAVRARAEEANQRARQALDLSDLPMHLRLRPVHEEQRSRVS